MKKERIFWGLFLIFGAVFLLVSNMGLIEGVGFWTVIGTIFFVAMLIKSIFSVEFTGIFFSIAFLGIIYDEQLHIEQITPWPILGAALLLSIGFGMIFHKHSHKCWKNESYHTEYEQVVDEVDGNTIKFDVNFGSVIKYVNSDDFQKASLDCSFASMKVYFDNAMMQHEQAEIYVDVSFGGVELFVPKTWTVVNQIHSSFGGVDEKNHGTPDGVHTVYLTGENSFAGVTIIYV